MKGFSEENIKLMRRFYEAWKDIETNSVVGTTEITDFNNSPSSANSVVETTDLQKADSEADPIRQLRLTSDDSFPITAFLNIHSHTMLPSSAMPKNMTSGNIISR